MVRDNGASAFTHNDRMRHTFGIAHVHDIPDHVVGVFLERIIDGAIEVTARSIVIDAKASTDIEVTKLMSEFAKLCVIARPSRTARLIVEMSGTCDPTWK